MEIGIYARFLRGGLFTLFQSGGEARAGKCGNECLWVRERLLLLVQERCGLL